MTAYYNEHDAYAAQWLRNLIAAGHIAPGDVDERDIRDIKPEELKKYTQCHFFAGVGVWSLALRQAGWPDDQPVWTGSCPCQPFSAAGRKAGVDDERHLWPHWFHLITQCEPSHIFGEQVASKDGLGWLDLVQTDLEGAGYANGAVDLCAAGIGAPHIRQRLWFVAERLGDTCDAGPQKHGGSDELYQWPERERETGSDLDSGLRSGMADADTRGLEGKQGIPTQQAEHSSSNGVLEHNGPAGPVNGFWRDADWLFCRDGKWRVVRSGTFPLVDGPPSRVGRLRAYGNAINAEVAQAFIEAYLTDQHRGSPDT